MHTTQQRTGDIRLRQDEARQPQPNRRIWASRRFFNNADTEEEYLKQWLLALQDQDWSTQARWRDYCVERGDGTYNPLAHAPGFIRRFIFLYGSQPPHFWTQHQTIGLLSALEAFWNSLRRNTRLRIDTESRQSCHGSGHRGQGPLLSRFHPGWW